MEHTFGNLGTKRTISLDKETVKVMKTNGDLIQSWNLADLKGVAYKAPNAFVNGVLVFCENYQDSLETSLVKLGMVSHSVAVTFGNRNAAKEVIAWFNSEKGIDQ
jgi:hypothetical protein